MDMSNKLEEENKALRKKLKIAFEALCDINTSAEKQDQTYCEARSGEAMKRITGVGKDANTSGL